MAKQNVGTSRHRALVPAERTRSTVQSTPRGGARPPGGDWKIGGAELTFSNGMQAKAGLEAEGAWRGHS